MHVESNGADRIVATEFLRFSDAATAVSGPLSSSRPENVSSARPAAAALLRVLQTLAFAIENQFRVFNERHAVRVGKFFSSGTDEVDMRALFENQTRRLDGIAQSLDAGHAACFHSPPSMRRASS